MAVNWMGPTKFITAMKCTGKLWPLSLYVRIFTLKEHGKLTLAPVWKLYCVAYDRITVVTATDL